MKIQHINVIGTQRHSETIFCVQDVCVNVAPILRTLMQAAFIEGSVPTQSWYFFPLGRAFLQAAAPFGMMAHLS